MWQRKFRRFLQIIAGIISKLWTILRTIIKKCRVIQQPKFRRPLLISSGIMGIIGVLVIMMVVPLSYTPNTAAFPYIPPPEGNYYIQTTPQDLYNAFTSRYLDPLAAQATYVGESFIFKNILIDEDILSRRHETYVFIDLFKLVPQNPSDLQELKEGERVDIIGVCMGLSKEYLGIELTNCLFLPAGVAPLPLPGGLAPITGGY